MKHLMKIFLSTQGDPLGNQTENKKDHLEEGKLKKEGSLILTWTGCTRSYLSIMTKPQMWLYFKGRDKPLTNEDGKLKAFGKLKSILGKNRLFNLGFDVPSGKLTSQQAVILNKAEEEMPSTSDVANADDIELQEITKNEARSTENLIVQLEGESSKDLPMRELLGLDKQLRSI